MTAQVEFLRTKDVERVRVAKNGLTTRAIDIKNYREVSISFPAGVATTKATVQVSDGDPQDEYNPFGFVPCPKSSDQHNDPGNQEKLHVAANSSRVLWLEAGTFDFFKLVFDATLSTTQDIEILIKKLS